MESITRKTVRERTSGLSPPRTFLRVSMNLEWTVFTFATTDRNPMMIKASKHEKKTNGKIKCCEPHQAREKNLTFGL